MRRSRVVRLLILACWALVSACTPEELNTERPSGSVLSPGSGEAGTSTTDTGWEEIGASLEFRRIRFSAAGRGGDFAILRLDPKAYHIRVAYDADDPGNISEWAEAIEPLALINGGYFDENNRATALVIFDGIVRGASYEGFGGMVVVNAAGEFELRSLRQQPYDPSEELRQAMQSAPMLIQPGGVLSELEADNDRSRRTVIARDVHGRILLMVCDFPIFTLKELATLLEASDLELDAALNLDGGRSTGMYVQTPAREVMIDSFDRVPLVLVVEKKG